MKSKNREIRRSPVTLQNILKLPYYFTQGVKYHAAGRIYTPKPLYSTLRVSHRCNSRCVMCDDWKKQDTDKELTPAEIGEIYRNPLFSSLEKLSLSGGEPTLREDLVQIAQVVLDACPNIKEMSLLTNGLEANLVVEKVKELLSLSDYKRVGRFSVLVSLDGYGATHQKIRGVPQAFERVSETINRLQMLQRKTPFYLCSACVVQPLNVNNLVQLAEFGQEIGLPITFAPVCTADPMVKDTASKKSLRLSNDYQEKLRTIFGHQLQPNLMLSNVPFWQEYFSIVSGKKRKLPCFLCRYYVSMDIDGTMCMCPVDSSLVYGNARDELPDRIWYSDRADELRKRVEKYFCSRCTICCDTAFSFNHEFFCFAGFLIREKSRQLFRK